MLFIPEFLMLKYTCTFFLVLSFASVRVGFGQTKFEQIVIPMEAAIARALDKNNQVKASEYALRKASWDHYHSWTRLLPIVSFNTNYTWIDDSTYALRDFTRYLPFPVPKTVFQNSFYSSFNVTMPVFNASILNGISMASKGKAMAEDLNASARRTIIFQVIQSYLNVLKNKEILDQQKEYLDLSRLNFEKAERLYDSGRYSKTDAMRWQVDYQRQMSIVTTSESNLRRGRIILSRLLNAALGEFFEVEKRIPERLLRESNQLLTLEDMELLELIQLDDESLISANAALAAAKKSEEISESGYRNTYNAYLPVINLTYLHAWRENATLALDDYSPKTLLVNLSVPIFTSFQNFTRLKAAYYDYRRSQENFNDQLLNIRFILTETVNKLINLKTQKELSKVSVAFNERNYNIVEQQREKGLVSNIELVDAKLNLQDARLADITNYYDFISGMVELYYLLGKLDKIVDAEILMVDPED